MNPPPPQPDDAKTPCYSCQPWLESQPQISFFSSLCRDAPGQAELRTQHGHDHTRGIHRLCLTLPPLLPGFWGAFAAPLLPQGPNAARSHETGHKLGCTLGPLLSPHLWVWMDVGLQSSLIPNPNPAQGQADSPEPFWFSL